MESENMDSGIQAAIDYLNGFGRDRAKNRQSVLTWPHVTSTHPKSCSKLSFFEANGNPLVNLKTLSSKLKHAISEMENTSTGRPHP